MFYGIPPRHYPLHKPIKLLTVVVLRDMAELVKDYVVDALAGGFNQVGV